MQIINLSNSMDYDDIVILCDKLIGNLNELDEQLLTFMEKSDIEDLINISQVPYYIKQTEFETYLVSNPKIKFSCIEDWKNENKFNSIMLLIALNYLNESILHSIIGNHSKKTYANGTIINDNSLALKKFFNPDYRQFRTGFYKKLDVIIKLLVKEGANIELVEKTVYSMIAIIQADITCRTKYENGEYFEYKTKIADIVETRNKEDILYNLFYKTTYNKLVNDPKHSSLKYLLFNSWTDTKEKYTWLTELITFINNNSNDAKDYLINNVGISEFVGTDYITKCKVIEEVSYLLNLNMKFKKQIINYIFSIGAYYKHRTYNKWYTNEYESIELFDKYKENELEETLKNLTKELNFNDDYAMNELMTLMSDYYITMTSKFS
jgi:hypothetical protein